MVNRLVLGVIGHVDHGKTALVRALTGMETDRLPEEKRRGISIALGFAHAEIDGAEIDFIDMPGHERFVRTMVSGAGGVQAVLLAVAANEGIKPQTREHVEVAALLGVQRAVVAVTKADLVDAAWAEQVGEEARALAVAAGLAAPSVTTTSAVDGRGLEALAAALAAVAAEVAPSPDQGWPYLPIDRAFTLAGHGTVVTGTVRRGCLALGDALEVVPSGRPVRVRGLQVHGRPVEVADPGQRVAVNLRGVEVGEVGRGAALAHPALLAPATWLTVELRAASDAAELKTGARLSLLIGTEETPARLRLLDRDRLAPGEAALAQLHCAEPVAAPAAERFVLRVPSPPLTVAGGRVLDPDGRRLRRKVAALLAHWSRLAELEGADAAAFLLEEAKARGLALSRLAQLVAATPEQAFAMLEGLRAVRTRGDVAVSRSAFEQAGVALLRQLNAPEAREGVRPARLREQLAEVGPEVLDEVLARLAAGGRLRVEGGSVRLVRVAQDRARARSEAELAGELADALRRGGLSPPDATALGPTREARVALDRLVRSGVAVRTYDKVQKREIVFHREAVEAARRTLMPLLADGPGLLVGEVGAALGVSRKYSVPLLEHLDAIGFTRRVGELRVLGRAAES